MEDIFEQKNQSLLSKLSEVTLQNSNLINLRRNDKRKIKHLRKDIKDLKTYIEEYDQYINNTYY
jgi:selenocysteine-specific translation elongation factor